MIRMDRTGEKVGYWLILSTTTGDGPAKHMCECGRCGAKREWRYNELKQQRNSGKLRCPCSSGSLRNLAKRIVEAM